MLGVPGIAARTFAAVHHEGISVSLITQASSEHSICFSVRRRARSARAAAWKRHSSGKSRGRKSTASRRAPGSRRSWWWGSAWRRRRASPPAYSPPGEAGINVIATAQGSSELNLSLVVDGKEAPRAQRVVHAAFQLSKIGGGAVAHPERSEVVLLGFGQIGRALAP